MATRLFAPAGSLTLPVTTVAANLALTPLSGTQVRIANASSNEACVLFSTGSAAVVVVPISTSSSLGGMSVIGNSVVGVDLGANTWISAICPTATATTNLRITMGEGGLT